MIDPADIEAKRPDEREYGPPAKGHTITAEVDIFSVFRWIKDRISKSKGGKRDNNT